MQYARQESLRPERARPPELHACTGEMEVVPAETMGGMREVHSQREITRVCQRTSHAVAGLVATVRLARCELAARYATLSSPLAQSYAGGKKIQDLKGCYGLGLR